MNRSLRVLGAVALLAIAVLAFWAIRTHSTRPSGQESLQSTMRSAVTNPVKFAKSRFTGGIGAVMLADPATGLPVIHEVIAGSPAGKAGLREGDCILNVDGVATAGRTLAQNVESIRGFAAGSVSLTIRRNGSTNLQCVIHRTSWKGLGVPQ